MLADASPRVGGAPRARRATRGANARRRRDGARTLTTPRARAEGARKGARYLRESRELSSSTSWRDAAREDAAREEGTAAATAARAKPEVLAPAGGWPQLRAAIEAGADCVYFGLDALNARARASNFTLDELDEVMAYVKSRGRRAYVTMNVLVFDEELRLAETLIRGVARAGVDAVIVQDVGVTRLIRKTAPNLPIHGSTQMSVTSAEGARLSLIHI